MHLTGSHRPSSLSQQPRLLRRAGLRGLPGLFLVFLSTIAVGACSSDAADETTDAGGDGDNPSLAGGTKGDSGGGSSQASGSSSSQTGGKSGIVIPETGGGDGAGGNGPTCASSTQQTDIKPIDMYIMFDRSSSMNNNTVPTLWEQATSALVAFLQAEGSSGFGVALRFFPDDLPVAGCRGAPGGGFGMGTGGDAGELLLCEPASCQDPLVPVGNLEAALDDPQETALVNAINSKDVLIESQGTPTHPALSGALDWGRNRLVAAPDRLPIVILVTDGAPTGCDIIDIPTIAALASEGLADGIRTYVVGLEGSSEAAIRQIATGGGTEGIFIGGAGVDAGTALIDALNEIRGEALSCEFPTPTTDTGAIVDTSKVNLVVTLGDASEVPVFKVADEASCAGAVNWYYTDDTKATIALCPAACDIVQGDENASIDVQLGCASQVIE